jgi:hypothetical protein
VFICASEQSKVWNASQNRTDTCVGFFYIHISFIQKNYNSTSLKIWSRHSDISSSKSFCYPSTVSDFFRFRNDLILIMLLTSSDEKLNLSPFSLIILSLKSRQVMMLASCDPFMALSAFQTPLNRTVKQLQHDNWWWKKWRVDVGKRPDIVPFFAILSYFYDACLYVGVVVKFNFAFLKKSSLLMMWSRAKVCLSVNHRFTEL